MPKAMQGRINYCQQIDFIVKFNIAANPVDRQIVSSYTPAAKNCSIPAAKEKFIE